MHRAQLNRAVLRLRIEPVGPLLIRSGKTSIDPTHPDLECVRTRHGLGLETVYLPGSSIKGVVRAQAERILRSVERYCCDPLQQKNNPCQDNKKGSPADRFARQCAACRTFGSLAVAGRTRFADAYPWPAGATREEAQKELDRIQPLRARTGVAIDRKTGATKRGALYDLEVIEAGKFHTELSCANFQLWQLRLLLHVLADVDEGFVRLGSGKSRGMGRVRCRIDELVVQWLPRGGDEQILGVGSLMNPKEAEDWKLVAPDKDRAALPSGAQTSASSGLFQSLVLKTDQVPALAESLGGPWAAFLQWPKMAAKEGRP